MSKTRKYFGTDGIRGRVGESLITPEFVLKLGWAAGVVLGQGGNGNYVIIGKDTRISGYMLESALEAGLSAAGMFCHLTGPMPTPAIAYLTRTYRAQAGIVISASHNKYYDNGIKFFSNEGKKISDDIQFAIEELIEQPLTLAKSDKLGKAKRFYDAPSRYIEFCKSTVPHGLKLTGIKVVVDCANGATYHVAPNVLRELGADVVEVATEPNGTNINELCGSTTPETLQQAVIKEKANFGMALDGDGDRVLMVDDKGELVDGDQLIYIMARYSGANYKSQGIVGTVMSNLGLEQALSAMDIKFVRTKVGDRYVMQTLLKNGWILGGEPSGHIVNLNLTTTGDGIISALQVIRAICDSGKSLHEIKSGMNKYPHILLNVPVTQHINVDENKIIKEAVNDATKTLGKSGRILLRASGTEPVIRVMVEGENQTQVSDLAKQLSDVVTSVAEAKD